MKLTTEQINHWAHLVRLGLKPDQVSNLAQELAPLWASFNQLEQVDTHNIQPMVHPVENVAWLRKDQVKQSVGREQLQSVAPQVEQGVYLVPKVIE